MRKFFSSSLVVSSFLFLSKLLGFVRDLLLATFFGSSSSLQAFLVAFRFPEFMRKVTSSGVLTQIINPYFYGRITERKKRFFASILCFLALLILIITLIAICFSDLWVDIYAYGLASDTDVLKIVNSMFVIMIPYVLFNGIMGLISAVLNSHSKYFVSSLLPVLLNVVMIVGVLISPKFDIPIYSVAYSVLVAGIIQVSVGFFSLWHLFGRIQIDTKIIFLKDLRSRVFLKKLPIAFLGTAILQINSLIETFFASFLISGSLAWLYYADRVNQFLYGVFGTAIATVIIPYLINCKKNKIEFFETLARIIRFTLLITIPAVVGLFVLAKPIVITLFYYGKFKIIDVDSTYLAIIGYLLSLFCFVVARVIVSALYVQNKVSKVFYISLVCLALSISLYTIVVHFFSDSKYAFVYLAFVSSFVALINLFVQMLILIEFRMKLFAFVYLNFITILRILIACSIMCVVLKWFNLNDSYWITLSMSGRLRSICLIITAGVITYIGVIVLLGGLKSLRIRKLNK